MTNETYEEYIFRTRKKEIDAATMYISELSKHLSRLLEKNKIRGVVFVDFKNK